MSNLHATVVGAGLAGSEAAWQLARQGIAVTLIEMKPEKMSQRIIVRCLRSWSARTLCAVIA